jgi:hypothetical protein
MWTDSHWHAIPFHVGPVFAFPFGLFYHRFIQGRMVETSDVVVGSLLALMALAAWVTDEHFSATNATVRGAVTTLGILLAVLGDDARAKTDVCALVALLVGCIGVLDATYAPLSPMRWAAPVATSAAAVLGGTVPALLPSLSFAVLVVVGPVAVHYGVYLWREVVPYDPGDPLRLLAVIGMQLLGLFVQIVCEVGWVQDARVERATRATATCLVALALALHSSYLACDKFTNKATLGTRMVVVPTARARVDIAEMVDGVLSAVQGHPSP